MRNNGVSGAVNKRMMTCGFYSSMYSLWRIQYTAPIRTVAGTGAFLPDDLHADPCGQVSLVVLDAVGVTLPRMNAEPALDLMAGHVAVS